MSPTVCKQILVVLIEMHDLYLLISLGKVEIEFYNTYKRLSPSYMYFQCGKVLLKLHIIKHIPIIWHLPLQSCSCLISVQYTFQTTNCRRHQDIRLMITKAFKALLSIQMYHLPTQNMYTYSSHVK